MSFRLWTDHHKMELYIYKCAPRIIFRMDGWSYTILLYRSVGKKWFIIERDLYTS